MFIGRTGAVLKGFFQFFEASGAICDPNGALSAR